MPLKPIKSKVKKIRKTKTLNWRKNLYIFYYNFLISVIFSYLNTSNLPYLPAPPLGQDMTRGHLFFCSNLFQWLKKLVPYMILIIVWTIFTYKVLSPRVRVDLGVMAIPEIEKLKSVSILFGSVSLFNTKAILEEQWWYNTLYLAVGKRRFITFPRDIICLKVNVRAQMEFELAHYDITVQHVSHYGSRDFPALTCII